VPPERALSGGQPDLVVPGVGRDVKLRNLTPTGDKPDITVRRQRRPQRSCS
jgi:hypothetical protein